MGGGHLKGLGEDLEIYTLPEPPSGKCTDFAKQKVVMFKGNYEFSFNFRIWSTEILSIDQEPHNAAKCRSMPQTWGKQGCGGANFQEDPGTQAQT